ncbi:hypothetical protein [Novosphingobium rosa]|uniref:hypothetical protein n=1 Tax=Novosphingobium rosa TaxID=76978 RepID=UPI0012ECDF8A|nr:hypothetical protein [Novosphingobium rosa]
MAGTILIDRDNGVALNSVGYHRILEAVRAQLNSEDARSTEGVFAPNDLEGMSFISLVEADTPTFRCFHSAAIAAYSGATESGYTFTEWDELMEKLKRDPRSVATG